MEESDNRNTFVDRKIVGFPLDFTVRLKFLCVVWVKTFDHSTFMFFFLKIRLYSSQIELLKSNIKNTVSNIFTCFLHNNNPMINNG